jgi:transcriptional regulator with XRE-family HTH domain
MPSNKLLAGLGRKIRFIREAAGLSQEDAAMEADLDRAYYGRIERGQVNVSALNLLKIAKALKVDVGDFFPKRAV